MAEHAFKRKIIGVAFDGTGYGTDGNLWGGEFLIADIEGFERPGRFAYVPLPGGESAIREPWKTAVSMVMLADPDKASEHLESAGFVQRIGATNVKNVMKIAASRELSPLSSGAGRLFDGVSALLGVCDTNTFEGEAAMALEALVTGGNEEEYPIEYIREQEDTVVSFGPCIRSIIDDIRHAVSLETVSSRFHNTVAGVVENMVLDLSVRHGLRDVALSGGTFQNLYLLNRIIRHLRAKGLRVYTNEKVPCNDGGISLGQAYLVRERLRKCGI